MIYALLLLIIFLIWEVLDLKKKKLKKSMFQVLFLTFILVIVNLLYLIPSLNKDYSSVIYLLNFKKEHMLLFIIWFLINGGCFGYLLLILMTLRKKHKQNKPIMMGISLGLFLMLFFFIFYLFNNISVYLILGLSIIICYFLIKIFMQKNNIFLLLPLFVLFILIYQNYFNYEGAVRFKIALMGYPLKAYKCELENMEYLQEKNVQRFYPIEEIKLIDGNMGMFVVYNYSGLKIAKYVNF